MQYHRAQAAKKKILTRNLNNKKNFHVIFLSFSFEDSKTPTVFNEYILNDLLIFKFSLQVK